jgi:hypothetical protein
MELMKEHLYNIGTHLLTLLGIFTNIDNIKGAILFFGSLTLLSLQIYLHVIKIRKENKRKKQIFED